MTAVAAALLWGVARRSMSVTSLRRCVRPCGGCRSCWPASFSRRSPPSRSQLPRRRPPRDIVRATGDLLLWQPRAVHVPRRARANGARGRAHGPARPPGARVLRLPAAGCAARSPRPGAEACGGGARPRARRRHALVLQAEDRQALPVQPGETAFVGYRIESGVLMVSGDPVGEQKGWDAAPVLVRVRGAAFAQACRSRRQLGGARLLEQAGLRALYIGDEAIVDAERFSLEGRPIRKVRQSVSRLRKAGYRHGSSPSSARSTRRRQPTRGDRARTGGGAPERGFSMAMDSLRNPHGEKTLVVYAVDDSGEIRGFLHFVPPMAATPSRSRSCAVSATRQRAHRVPDRRGDRAPARARRRRGLAQLRRVRPPHPRAERGRRAHPRPRSSLWATRGSRSSGSIASTPSSSRAGSRVTSCTSAGSACRARASPRSGSRGSCRSRRSGSRHRPLAPDDRSAMPSTEGGSTASTVCSRCRASQTQKSASGTSTSAASSAASTCSPRPFASTVSNHASQRRSVAATAAAEGAHEARRAMPQPVAPRAAASAMSNPTQATSQWPLVCRPEAGRRARASTGRAALRRAPAAGGPSGRERGSPEGSPHAHFYLACTSRMAGESHKPSTRERPRPFPCAGR